LIETEQIPDSRKDVRKFGLMFSVVGVVIAGIAYFRQYDVWPVFLLLAAFFLLTALFVVPLLRPIYVGWMKFAFILGWINTRIILGIAFFLVLTPIGVLMRLFGKNPIDVRLERERESYWVKRDVPYDPHHSERQF
jgi:Saxitoxin biosynthesis operon protein SxtJ